MKGLLERTTLGKTSPVIITDGAIPAAFLSQLREHHNDLHVLLDGHLPELKACLFGGALCRDVLPLSPQTETPGNVS